jgi:hypothetical protein
MPLKAPATIMRCCSAPWNVRPADVGVEVGADADAGTNAATDADAEADAAVEAVTAVDAETGADAEAGADAGTGVEAITGADTASGAAADGEAAANGEAGSGPAAEDDRGAGVNREAGRPALLRAPLAGVAASDCPLRPLIRELSTPRTDASGAGEDPGLSTPVSDWRNRVGATTATAAATDSPTANASAPVDVGAGGSRPSCGEATLPAALFSAPPPAVSPFAVAMPARATLDPPSQAPS